MSLRGRLLAASLALVAVGLTGAGLVTYIALRGFLLHRIDLQLDSAHTSLTHQLQSSGSLPRSFVNLLGSNSPGGVFVQVRDPQGIPIASVQSSNPGGAECAPVLPINLPPPTRLPAGRTDPFAYQTVRSTAGGHCRIGVSPLTFLTDTGQTATGALVVGMPLQEASQTLARLILVELLVGSAVLAAAALLGSWLVRLGLRPLVEIEGTAGKIAAGDLTERVARADDRTEVGRLGQALNSMMSRIEAAFEERRASEAALRTSEERLRRFVSDASHELRTPVASVRAYSELFRRGGDRHPEDLPRLMARIESEAARMGLLVEDLLLLTRLDQGRPLEMAPVDLGALAADSVEAARIIDPERPVSLHVEGSVEVIGDRDRLRQVTDNLLANVRTHTPAGAAASVTVRLDGGRAIVEVADCGPGIDPEDTEHIFERFFRSDPSRTRDRGGSGLGLSIVAAITAAHGGTASAANRPGPDGGAIFTINLPALVEVAAGPASNGGKQGDPDLQAGSEPDHTPVSLR